MSIEVMPLKETLEEVRRKSLDSDPVRGLFWLALTRGGATISSRNEADDLLLRLANELCDADKEGRRHQVRDLPNIREMLVDMPTAVSFGKGDILDDPVALRVPEEMVLTIDSAGIGSGKLTISNPGAVAWTPMGLAISNWDSLDLDSDPEELNSDDFRRRGRVQVENGLLPPSWVMDQFVAYGFDPRVLDFETGRETAMGCLAEPIGGCMPAYRDDRGVIHDAWDLLSERLVWRDLSWITARVVEAWGEDAGGVLAGRHAMRAHDIAQHEMRVLNAQQRPGTRSEQLALGSEVRLAVAGMILGGACVHAAQWGRRNFGFDHDPLMQGALANVIFEVSGSFAAQNRLRAFQRLHALGHDVVVAHESENHRDRTFSSVPLWDAIARSEGDCVAQLMEWGASTDVSIHNVDEGGALLEMVQDREESGPGHVGVRAFRAAMARRAARSALDDLAAGLPAP